jgi:hypothetical protein
LITRRPVSELPEHRENVTHVHGLDLAGIDISDRRSQHCRGRPLGAEPRQIILTSGKLEARHSASKIRALRASPKDPKLARLQHRKQQLRGRSKHRVDTVDAVAPRTSGTDAILDRLSSARVEAKMILSQLGREFCERAHNLASQLLST